MKETPQEGNLGDPRGKWDEKWYDGSVAPIGQDNKHKKGLKRVLVVAKGFQDVRVPIKIDVHARDTRTGQVYAYNVRCTRKLTLLSRIAAIKNDVYQQQNDNDSCKIKLLKY